MTTMTATDAERSIRFLSLVRSLWIRGEPNYRDINPQHWRSVLRAAMDLPALDPSQIHYAASSPRVRLDVEAWAIWAEAGLSMFARSLPGGVGEAVDGEGAGPTMPTIVDAMVEVRRVMVVIAMLRSGGNLTRASQILGTSRRTLRTRLQELGLYPWGAVVAQGAREGSGHEPRGDEGDGDGP